jgi:PAS domain S-box-containing protein
MKKIITEPPSPHYYRNTILSTTISDKEEKYKTIIENLIHAFFLVCPNGSISDANKMATSLFEYSQDELMNLDVFQIIENPDPIFKSSFQDQLDVIKVKEATAITKTGIRFPVEISAVFFIDADGIGKYGTMVADITLRKKAEAALQLSNERYNLVVKATKELVWDWDMVTDEIYRSGHNLTEVYGHSSNKYIKNINDWIDFIHPDDKEKIKAQIDYYIQSPDEKSFTLEYRFRKEDGKYVYINDKGYIIRNASGKAIRMIGAAEDITDRKIAAQVTEESEIRYKMFIQQSTEGIWRIELKEPMPINLHVESMLEFCFQNAYIAECNDAFAKTYGYKKAEEIIGSNLNKILPAENPLNMRYLVKFFTQGFKIQDELSYEIDKDGNQLVFLNNMVGLIEGNFINRAWGTQKNITHQKNAEKKLIERENHLKAIVDNDPECIKLLNKEGVILEMNPSGLQMIGAEKTEQILGKNALTLILPEYHEEFKRILQDVFDGNTAIQIFQITGFHKKQLYLESHLVPLKNAGGVIIAALAVTRDITENIRAQAQLQASEKKYRYLFNNNPSTIVIWDIETLKILEVNETAIDLYGYSRNEFLSLNIHDLSIITEDTECMEYIKNVRTAENKKTSFDCMHITKKGSHIIVEIKSHEITYKDRNAILAIGNNITEKIQLEKSLNEERMIRQHQITEAVISGQEKERTELGQELHDNINQILASTKLYIECAIKDENPRKDLMTESKLLIEKAMTELRTLSKSLLPPSLGETGLKQALLELIDNIQQVHELEITLDWQIHDESEMCKNFKLTIFRITQEQLNNIIKHANAKSAVIKIAEFDEIIEISLRDDGLGFNTSLKRNGVGLRNITSRAEVNNGIVSIISKPGEGCELIVKFPK